MPPASGSFHEPRRLDLSRPLMGSLRVPGSKSLAQRALLAAALGRGCCELHGLPEGEDVQACLGVVRALGARLELGPSCRIEGLAGDLSHAGPLFQVGESGTLARLSTAVLGLAGEGREFGIQARGSLLMRHSPALLRSLQTAGTVLRRAPGATGSWPLELQSSSLPSTLTLQQPSSSQELSALWFACAAFGDSSEVMVEGSIPSAPYLDLTEQVLARFGVQIKRERLGPQLMRARLQGRLSNPDQMPIEADASSAAVALAAACLSGGQLETTGFPEDSRQGDLAVLRWLEHFGCRTERGSDRLQAGGFPSRGASIDLSEQPDLAPPLAIVAAAAAEASGETSELFGLGTLRGKESDRLAVLEHGLGQAGWAVEVVGDCLRIGPPQKSAPQDLVLDPEEDHRMAFAFALLGLLRPKLRVASPACVSKSWPGFWEALQDR